jgi:hypothetical protein
VSGSQNADVGDSHYDTRGKPLIQSQPPLLAGAQSVNIAKLLQRYFDTLDRSRQT